MPKSERKEVSNLCESNFSSATFIFFSFTLGVNLFLFRKSFANRNFHKIRGFHETSMKVSNLLFQVPKLEKLCQREISY